MCFPCRVTFYPFLACLFHDKCFNVSSFRVDVGKSTFVNQIDAVYDLKAQAQIQLRMYATGV